MSSIDNDFFEKRAGEKYWQVKTSLKELEEIVKGVERFSDELEIEEVIAKRFGKVLELYYINDKYNSNTVGIVAYVYTDKILLKWNTFDKTVVAGNTSFAISHQLAQTMTNIFCDIEYFWDNDGLFFRMI